MASSRFQPLSVSDRRDAMKVAASHGAPRADPPAMGRGTRPVPLGTRPSSWEAAAYGAIEISLSRGRLS